MDLEVLSEVEAFQTNQIEDIDAKGYLIINSDSDVETEKRNDTDMEFGFEKEEANDVMGKVFDTPDDAYDFYNRYAFLHGFGIRISSAFKNKRTNEQYRKLYVCNKEGFKDLKYTSSNGDVKKRRRDTRTGCEAFIRISKNKDLKYNIFWADGRSRDSYIKFRDVVVFDVTYMTNKFMMPFAPIVGVNHHGQSILFGGALLENEKQDTFEWLFQNFLKCMFDKYPLAIITDQDKAICNAIKIVFPKTRHRYCSWHIKKHEIEHLRPLKVLYSDFEELHRQWTKSDTVEEFETRWEYLCGKYNFQSGSWITEMYNQRKYWAKAFLKDCFFAGMTSSGRSESIHSFFDGYVNSKTMLNEFVVQYDKAVEARRAAEEDEDFRTMNSKPALSSINLIEAKAGSRYTKKAL